MDIDKFRGAFEESCNFVRLHGWCDQSDERISALLSLIHAQKTAYPAISDLVQETLGRVDSIEEKLLIFALMAELGTAAQEIAELMYRHLQGRLTNEDSSFVIRYFFRGSSPIPDDIVYDITKRNFISYQRAIFQALKVSRFESAFEPSQILLFLIQLLCRNNLNEQNRAILYLLLSRIDIELPPSIERTVKAAMLSLRDVIHEVELRLEAVLSDTLQQNDLTLEEGNWERPPPAAKKPAVPKAPASGSVAKPEPSIAEDQPSSELPPVSLSTPSTKSTPYAGDYFNTPAPVFPQESPRKAPTPAARPSPVSSPVFGEASPTPQTVPLSKQSSQQAPPAPAITSFDTAGIFSARQSTVADPMHPAEPAAIPRPGDVPTFLISFSRETSELKAVLQALQESTAPAATSRGEKQPGDPGDTRRPARSSRGDRFSRIPRWAWLAVWLLCVLVALALLVWWLVPRGQASPAVESSPAPSPRSSSNPADRPGLSSAAMETSTALVLKNSGEKTLWYPRTGESLWKVYSWIRNTPGLDPGLTALVAAEWQGFLQAISQLNPGLSFPDLIYPNKPIVIRAGESN